MFFLKRMLPPKVNLQVWKRKRSRCTYQDNKDVNPVAPGRLHDKDSVYILCYYMTHTKDSAKQVMGAGKIQVKEHINERKER